MNSSKFNSSMDRIENSLFGPEIQYDLLTFVVELLMYVLKQNFCSMGKITYQNVMDLHMRIIQARWQRVHSLGRHYIGPYTYFGISNKRTVRSYFFQKKFFLCELIRYCALIYFYEKTSCAVFLTILVHIVTFILIR